LAKYSFHWHTVLHSEEEL